MDYETAMACQVEIDALQREAYRLERRHNLDLRPASIRPMKPLAFLGVWRM